MTIYDADFVAEEALQNQYKKPGVEDFAAESQDVESSQQEVSEDIQDQIPDAEEMVEEVSEKELNFRALRESIANEKRERELEKQRYQNEIDSMKNQIDRMRNTDDDQISKSKGALDDFRDDDLMTIAAYKKAQEEREARYQEELRMLRFENMETKAKSKFSDYEEVMEKYSIPLLRNNQDFARAFQMAENPAEFAYQLGRMQMGMDQPREQVQTPQVSKAERIVQNSRKPGTLSSARGGQANLSKADYYASMNEAEFAAFVQKNLDEV